MCCVQLQAGSELKKLTGFQQRTTHEYEQQRCLYESKPSVGARMESSISTGKRKRLVAEEVSWRECDHGEACKCSKQEYVKSLGINTFQQAYANVPHFQPVLCVPRDLMHVELEGTLKSHLTGVLYMAFKLRWFTLNSFNAAICTWPFLPGKRPDILHKKPEGMRHSTHVR